MAVSLKHTFTSNVADSGDATLVQPSNWNAEHTLTAAANTLLGAVSAGAVGEITCTAAGRNLLDDADAAAQRTTLGVGTGDSPSFTGLTLTGVGALSAGTALLPSLVPSGDPNTGLWFPAADTIALSTNGSEDIRLHASGGISIGNTTDPGIGALIVNSTVQATQLRGGYNNTTGVANTAAQALGTNTVSMVLISANTTLTSTVPPAGSFASVIIRTSGTTTRTVTFGTGFKSQGTLATGATADRFWVVNFVSDGTFLYESSRTTTAYA